MSVKFVKPGHVHNLFIAGSKKLNAINKHIPMQLMKESDILGSIITPNDFMGAFWGAVGTRDARTIHSWNLYVDFPKYARSGSHATTHPICHAQQIIF